MSQTCIYSYDNTDLSTYRQVAKYASTLVVTELKSLLVSWQKVTVALSSAGGQRARWIDGVRGGGVDECRQWLTDVYRSLTALEWPWEGSRVLCVRLCHTSWPPLPLKKKPQCSPSLCCEGHVVNAPLCCGTKKKPKHWAPLSASSAPCPDGSGLSCQGPGPSGSCVGLPFFAIHPIDFHPPQRGPVPWLALFHSRGIPQNAPCSRGLLSSYRQPGTDRVKAVILESCSEERENVYEVCEAERFRVSCPHHSTREGSCPVTALNINMSTRSYKHRLKENSSKVYRWSSVWLIRSVLRLARHP